MKFLAITQARIGSTRLPQKVLKQVAGKSILQIHLERALLSAKLEKLVVATTFEEDSDKILDIARQTSVAAYQGSTDDVLDRYYQIAKEYNPEFVVRITSDCPLNDPKVIDQVIEASEKEYYDFYSNTLEPTFPDGLDVEVIRFCALEKAWKEATRPSDREHVTPFIWRNSTFKGGSLFKSGNYTYKTDLSKFRLTVDEENDYKLIQRLVENLGDKKGWKSYIDYLVKHPDIFELNASIKRNEGMLKSIQKDEINK